MADNTSMPLRQQTILNELKDVMCDLGGLERDKIADHATFLELGFDSLFLAQMTTAYRKKFGVNVTFRQLLEEAPSPQALASYIDSRLPLEEPPPSKPQPAVVPVMPVPEPPAPPIPPPSRSLESLATVIPSAASSRTGKMPMSGVLFERLVSQQLQVMERQLEVLKYCQKSPGIQGTPRTVSVNQTNGHGLEVPLNGKPQDTSFQPAAPFSTDVARAEAPRFGPWKPIDKSANGSLDPQQRKHLEELVLRYTARTQKSKELTALHRPHLADPRVVAGFRTEWKEMVYPIVSARSAGSKLWDIDDNQYVDMIMGFGPALFGHSPDFVVRALEDQIKIGIEIGPQSPLVGEVARLVCDFTGMERATFCNTGSEAVLAALRVARTVTGRNKIALFAGSYHGIFDEVLVRSTRDGCKPLPVAPGIPPHMVQDVLVLRYGDPESLNIVRKHADELAAVLVEPVQSRHPDLQPREFLQGLRALTAQSGIALIFDEVITGFRLHSGGAQAWFGVQADLATYGKALGGGLPIGAVAGKARFMDALDGGQWNFGDASMPEAGVTYFAGTFVRHPLAIAAASAVLRHLQQAGPQLYQSLNDRASRLAKDLNRHFEEDCIPIHIQQCGSLFCVSFTQETRFTSLFFFYLREKGIHIWEGRPTFISTAHTNEDLAFVVRAMRESAEEMRRGGFFPTAGPGRKVTQEKPNDSPDLNGRVCPGASPIEPTATSTTPPSASHPYPLTEAQMEIWLATQLGNDASRAFNENILLQFKGTLDIDAMRWAVQRTVERHEALRTVFSADGNFQRVNPFAPIDIPLMDLSQLVEEDGKTRFEDLARTEVQHPFDLIKGPLVRVKIFRLAQDEHFLLVSAHHIVCDGWSIHVMLSDLSAFYESACNSQKVERSQPTPFREYAVWQLKQQNRPEGAATERYWLERFVDPVTALKLPTDRPRPAFRTFNGSCARMEFAKDLYARTKQFGASRGSTAFATFLAAFKVLLFRLTAQEDLVVGIGMAGQSIMGVDFLVGHCVNTLPLRNRIHPDQPFTDFLKSVNRSFLESYEHQNYTFGTLLQKLNLGRDPSQTPLISVMYNMDQELKGLSFGQLDFELYPDPNPYVNFDLSFNLCEKQGGLILECEYNRDLFDATTISRWLAHYEHLLEEIVSDPDKPISGLSVLSTAQRKSLLVEWNRTDSPYPRDLCIHEIFEAQASRSPDAVAVVFEGKELTYGELNRQANLLAHYLRGLGVGPDVLVGICLERSLEMVIALLGTLKAGGAYVPLDPAYPKERLSFMIRDAKIAVLLTQQRWIKILPEHETRAFCLDGNWERLITKKTENPVSATTPENLAYVIYTSGSTGRPKGVEVPHRGITRLLFGIDYAQLDSTQTFCHMAPISFDAATFELWGALLYGAKCVLYPGTFPTPAELKAVLHQNKVSVLWLTASLFNTVIDEAPEGLSEIRQLLIGGEPLSVKHVRRALELLPETQIVNCYGPTESTTFACCYPIPRQLDESLGSVPIGRPISNTHAYILDEGLERVPAGIPGELYIGGDGLARGYLNRPELTAKKFIRNPFGNNPSSRLYKTGDVARYLPNGNIEFVGRRDNQVKLRGFRIELGEIESILGQHPGVKKVVVLAREDNPGDKRLVGYIVPQRQLDLSTDGLRSYLKDRLPDYMVPVAFVFLDDLPLTPNGKIDRKKLPIPDQSRSRIVGIYQSPRTTMEKTLAGIWSEVLGVEKVGINDNFFDLGGHSLLAVRAVNLIKRKTGRTVRIADLFQAATVERMASALHDEGVTAPCSSLVPLQTKGSKPVFFWVHGDASSAYLPRYLDPDQRFYGIQHQSTDGQPALHRSVEAIATHYLKEIYSVQPHGPYRLGGNCFGGLVAFEIAHQLQKRGESVDLLALLNPASPWTGISNVCYSPISTLVNDLHHLLQAFLSFRLSGHSNDALKKVKNRISGAIRKPLRSVKKAAQKAVCTICERFSFSIPVSLRSRYILGIYFQALQFYVLRPFQGDMVLFLSQDFPRERRVNWSKQSTGIVTIHDVPGDHTGVLEDENVRVWAEKLASCLKELELEQAPAEKAVRALAVH